MPGAPQNNPEGRYWMLTIPKADWSVPEALDPAICYIKGQQEIGEGGYEHWQLMVIAKKIRRNALKRLFCQTAHLDLSRSQAAEAYVWKDETAVEGTRFEIGEKPFNRSKKTDWALAKQKAQAGLINEVPDDVYIKYYRTLKQIAMDNMGRPDDLLSVSGIWIHGPPGTGKSHYARQHHGHSLYLKAQNKWWDGYQGEKTVLIDDYDTNTLGHYLKIWADKYAFMAEMKGSSVQIRPDRIIITSNYTIEQLFPDPILAAAINRRFYKIYIPLRMG